MTLVYNLVSDSNERLWNSLIAARDIGITISHVLDILMNISLTNQSIAWDWTNKT